MANVNPIPDNYPRVSPHLSVNGAADAISFYKEMIGAEVEGGVDPSPRTLGGSPVALFVYVEDVDDVFRRALEAGADAVREPENQFYGDRIAMFDDPFGHRWNVATHTEDVAPDEIERRTEQAMSAG